MGRVVVGMGDEVLSRREGLHPHLQPHRGDQVLCTAAGLRYTGEAFLRHQIRSGAREEGDGLIQDQSQARAGEPELDRTRRTAQQRERGGAEGLRI